MGVRPIEVSAQASVGQDSAEVVGNERAATSGIRAAGSIARNRPIRPQRDRHTARWRLMPVAKRSGLRSAVPWDITSCKKALLKVGLKDQPNGPSLIRPISCDQNCRRSFLSWH